ncbi:MAG: hypothetical protein IAF58_03305, partial [Leptolyngbya sp.]|nr:hypothetical protein [Candidatus Melainabacteria bacterium]
MLSPSKPQTSGSFIKDWKPIAVLIVLAWSLITVFQVEPEARVKEWQRMSELPQLELKAEIQKKVEGTPGY